MKSLLPLASLIFLFAFKGDKNKIQLGEHSEIGNVVCYSSLTEWIASGSNDNKIMVWNASKHKLEKEWIAHSVGVKDLVFTPNSEYLISAGLDNLIKVWETKTWKLKHTLKGHSQQVLALAVSPDGKTLYSAGDDKDIIVWNLESFKKADVLGTHFDRVLSLNISKNGKYLVSTSGDRTTKAPGNLKVWNLEDKKLAYNLEEETYAINDASLSSKGTLVLYGGNFSDAIVLKWTENKVAARKKITDFGINSLVLDGLQCYFATSFNGEIVSWKIGNELKVLNQHKKDANSISISPAKNYLVSTGTNGKVLLTELGE
ncbi:MAG: WD40 repeat domain-containing protein [Bacteroidia bacterium]